jgi:hypothetical protein
MATGEHHGTGLPRTGMGAEPRPAREPTPRMQAIEMVRQMGRTHLSASLTRLTCAAHAAELELFTTTNPSNTLTGSAPHRSFLKVLTSSDCRPQHQTCGANCIHRSLYFSQFVPSLPYLTYFCFYSSTAALPINLCSSLPPLRLTSPENSAPP